MGELSFFIILLIVIISTGVIFHTAYSHYLKASSLAAITGAAIIQVLSGVYEAGDKNLFRFIRGMIQSFFVVFLVALLLGIPFVIYRKLRKREINQTS